MTRLTRPVRRVTQAGTVRRDLVITLYPGAVLGFRELRSRTEYTIHAQACYRLAIEAARAARLAERQASRRARRPGR